MKKPTMSGHFLVIKLSTEIASGIIFVSLQMASCNHQPTTKKLFAAASECAEAYLSVLLKAFNLKITAFFSISTRLLVNLDFYLTRK